jgi:hypothetical protein
MILLILLFLFTPLARSQRCSAVGLVNVGLKLGVLDFCHPTLKQTMLFPKVPQLPLIWTSHLHNIDATSVTNLRLKKISLPATFHTSHERASATTNSSQSVAGTGPKGGVCGLYRPQSTTLDASEYIHVLLG